MKTLKNILLIGLFGLLFIACSKDGEQGNTGAQGIQGESGVKGADGQDGEQGLSGEDGADGADGQNGTDGTQGETGTANVIYSEWFTNTFPEAPIADDNAFSVVNVPELTEEIKNSGLILVYARRLSGPDSFSVRQLPIIIFEPVNEHYYFDYNSTNNNLVIRLRTTDGTNINSFVYKEYRYVIVPGGIPAGGKSSLDYSKMSYEEVAVHFGIEG